ncbi:MAG: MoaD/ThiS family protein [Ardenticatenaceae bacterium]|nr:MoaD/ThiS family protein [Ardenticatenaceae bacterium]
MNLTIRVNGLLAEKMGKSRFSVSLASSTTVHDLTLYLQMQYPHLNDPLQRAVVISAGNHLEPTSLLQDGQEVALLLPIAGG